MSVSDCKLIQPQKGKLVNMASEFNVTGPLVERVSIDSEELSCAIDTRDIIVAVRESSREKGDKVCDKLMKGSMGPYFTSQDAYWKLYKRINALPPQGYKEFCYHGNRLLFMFPYIIAIF